MQEQRAALLRLAIRRRGQMFTGSHIKTHFSTSCENESIKKLSVVLECRTLLEMPITYSGMHGKRWINPPRHVIDNKYLIAMLLSIWRHHDNSATRGGSTGFQKWILYLIDKLGFMNKYFIEHSFKHKFFTCSLTIKELS